MLIQTYFKYSSMVYVRKKACTHCFYKFGLVIGCQNDFSSIMQFSNYYFKALKLINPVNINQRHIFWSKCYMYPFLGWH